MALYNTVGVPAVKDPTEILLQTGLLLSTLTLETQLPEPAPEWKEKLEALQEAGLKKKLATAIFEMRIEQVQAMGFHKFSSDDEAIKFLMGSPHTDKEEEKERKTYDWAYFHHDGKILEKEKCNWGSNYNQFIRKEKTGTWFLPPFSKVEVWRVVQHMILDNLKKPISHDVIVAINILKKLKIFNVFRAFEGSGGQTIITAQIWELPPNDNGEYSNAGQTGTFLIAKF